MKNWPNAEDGARPFRLPCTTCESLVPPSAMPTGRNFRLPHMTAFRQALRVFKTEDAASFAAELFRESFNSAFPSPAQVRILDTLIEPRDWHQYVAMYTWPDGTEECVGFCNWIRYRDVYLEGGLTVKRNFYRRLPKVHFADCAARGGVAQIMMETGLPTLSDCAAWFGYVGDAMSLQVTRRVGYVGTSHRYLIARWFRELSAAEQQAWVDEISRIGTF
jgi:hypothetical protein